jgi:hypothetical protein
LGTFQGHRRTPVAASRAGQIRVIMPPALNRRVDGDSTRAIHDPANE